MDIDSVKAKKQLEDLEDYKSARFWGSFFWGIPLFISIGSFAFGPIVGVIAIILMVVFCIPFKFRKVMYYILSALVIIMGITGGLGGVIFSVILCVFYVFVCVQNYSYKKQSIEIEEYEKSIES